MIFVPSFQTGSRFDHARTKNYRMLCLTSSENSTSHAKTFKLLSFFYQKFINNSVEYFFDCLNRFEVN